MQGDAGSGGSLAAYVERMAPGSELVAPGGDMPTVPLAAAALGVDVGRIVKSIVFQHKKDARQVCLAIVAGETRVHPGKVGRAVGIGQLKLASAETTLAASGYAVGGVPPVGHPPGLRVVVDSGVLRHDFVYGGGGDEHHMLRIAPGEIVRLTGAVVAPITAEPGTEQP